MKRQTILYKPINHELTLKHHEAIIISHWDLLTNHAPLCPIHNYKSIISFPINPQLDLLIRDHARITFAIYVPQIYVLFFYEPNFFQNFFKFFPDFKNPRENLEKPTFFRNLNT